MQPLEHTSAMDVHLNTVPRSLTVATLLLIDWLIKQETPSKREDSANWGIAGYLSPDASAPRNER